MFNKNLRNQGKIQATMLQSSVKHHTRRLDFSALLNNLFTKIHLLYEYILNNLTIY